MQHLLHGAHCRDSVEVALELVKMEVRSAIEIGCNRVAQILMTASGDELRCLVEHQRCTIQTAEHDTAMAALMVSDSGSECAGEFTRFDAAGKRVKSFTVGGPLPIGGGIQALPNGHLLVALYTQNKVFELDANGGEVWQEALRRPSSAYRLPNGHTLVSSRMSQVITELDKNGHAVANFSVGGRVLHVGRR